MVFFFCEGRSTSDALSRVKREIETATGEGGVTIAVSLDITNAFNSLPWGVIRAALEPQGFSGIPTTST